MRHWTHWQQPARFMMPKALRSWLTDEGSLTRRLQAICAQQFQVDLLGNRWAKPLIDESQLLQLGSHQQCFERQVRLMDGDTPLVYARTVVPQDSYRYLRQRFLGMGNRPLGEWLFTAPDVMRGPIQIACLSPQQRLYQLALQHESMPPDCVWARRSVFYLSGKALLINEVFLPNSAWSER